MSNMNVKNLERLENIVGKSLFKEIIAEMPGVSFRLPSKAEHYDIKKRNKQIIQEYYAGTEIDELAAKYGLSRSRIYKIIESR